MGYWESHRDDETRLVQLWNDGRSSSHIASLLGISRSAVVGKVFRLRNSGIVLRTERDQATRSVNQQMRHRAQREHSPKLPRPPSPKQQLLAQLKAEADAAPPAKAEDVAPLIHSVLDLEQKHCRWPIGNVSEEGFGFCGRGRVDGLPYCGKHAAIAFMVPLPLQGKSPITPAAERAKEVA